MIFWIFTFCLLSRVSVHMDLRFKHLRSSPCTFSRRSVNQPVTLLLASSYIVLTGFSSWLLVWTLSCRCPVNLSAYGYPPCFIAIFLFLTDQIFYRSCVHQQPEILFVDLHHCIMAKTDIYDCIYENRFHTLCEIAHTCTHFNFMTS